MAATQIILSLGKLFLMIIPGFVLARLHLINERQSKGISTIIIYLTWPCLIIMSLQRAFSVTICINMGILAVVMICEFAVAFIIAKLISKGMKVGASLSYLMIFMLMFGTTGFLGIPVCNALYAAEGTFYAALVESVQNIFVFTLGLALIEKSTGTRIGFSAARFLTPGFASVVIGLGLFATGATLPAILAEPMQSIGSATSPLAMIVIGYQLGKMRSGELFGDARLYALSTAKMILTPLIFMILIILFFPEMNTLAKVLILEIAMPVATSSAIFTQQYDGNTGFATKGIMLSTVIAIITLPAFAILVELL